MTALVRGVALGVTPCGPEAETYEVGQRVTWQDHWGCVYHLATVVEVWDDCIEISLDYQRGTHLVFAHELRPTDTPAPRTTT